MRNAWVLAAALAVAPVSARGQDFLAGPQVVDPGLAAPLVVDPLDGPVVRLDELGRVAADPPARPTVGRVQGVAGGAAVSTPGSADIGFTYLVPLWTFRDFQLAAPSGYQGLFPVFGDTGPVDSTFGYAPRVRVGYQVEDLDLGVSGTGAFLNLTGRVDRQASDTRGATGQLNGYANLTLAVVDGELNRLFGFEELFPRKDPDHPAVIDSVLDLRLGSRYVALDQNYSGTLVGGFDRANVATRYSSQSFRGIGVTTAADWALPCGRHFAPFVTPRFSLLVGENRRNSSLSVVAAGLPSFAATQLDSRTQLVPVSELEVGVDYGWELAERLRRGPPRPRFTVRVAGVAQFWGGMGPLSAGSSQGFRDTDLYLVGGYLQAGLRF